MTAVLDLFCCSGAASVGYSAAGLKVIGGVDIVDRPRYPFSFFQGDALQFLRDRADWIRRNIGLVHASPPCQAYCAITKGTHRDRPTKHPELYEPTRDLLMELGVPYVIENPAARADVVLCGEMFGLGVLRHRNFELGGWSAAKPQHIPHRGRVRGWRHGQYFEGPYIAAYGKGGGKGEVPEIQAAMGIHWTDERKELIEAIPPAYTAWLGRAFLAQQ
jgi:hypothetical protein